jgi:DUF3099 family protein
MDKPTERRCDVARDRKQEPVLITDAPESPDRERRRREIRYVAMMLVRALCLIAAAILVSTKPPLLGLWLTLCVLGMVVLPWLAVILANDRPPKKRAPRPDPETDPTHAALPRPPDGRVIDGE